MEQATIGKRVELMMRLTISCGLLICLRSFGVRRRPKTLYLLYEYGGFLYLILISFVINESGFSRVNSQPDPLRKKKCKGNFKKLVIIT